MYTPEALFSFTAKFGKFSALVALICLSYINGHTAYIAAHPKRFVTDCLLVGLAPAIALIFIAALRNKASAVANPAFLAFVLLFTFNVLRELSGMSAKTDERTPREKTVFKWFTWIEVVFLVTIVVLGCYFAYQAQVLPASKTSSLVLEAVTFAAIISAAEGLVSVNHGRSKAGVRLTVGLTFVAMALLHVAFQLGGFYKGFM